MSVLLSYWWIEPKKIWPQLADTALTCFGAAIKGPILKRSLGCFQQMESMRGICLLNWLSYPFPNKLAAAVWSQEQITKHDLLCRGPHYNPAGSSLCREDL